MIFYVILALGISLPLAFYLWFHRHWGLWESQGLPVVPPTAFIGSRPKSYQEIQQLKDVEYHKKYGKMWGEYAGPNPWLFVADPELVKEISVKDFDSFHDRRFFDLGDAFENSLDMLQGEQWKMVRSVMSPGFTSGKLKNAQEIFNTSGADLASAIAKDGKDGASLEISRYFGHFGLDVIASFGFGMDISTQKDPGHAFATNAHAVMNQDSFGSPWSLLFGMFPTLDRYLSIIPQEPAKFFAESARRIVRVRQENGVMRNDFVGLLVKAIKEIPTNKDFQRLKIDARLLENQIQLFLLAGFDTMRQTMTAMAYLMATHPDKQKRVQEEVDAALESCNGVISHEMLGKLEFLECCLNETLRLFPPLIRNERVAARDVMLDNIKVPKGTIVQLSSWALARDPDNFENPEDFVPERFEEGNKVHHPYAWIPFGHGPRSCIGNRFAMEQMKYGFAHIFKDLELFPVSDTPKTISDVGLYQGTLFLIGFTNIRIGAKTRSKK